MKLHKTNEKGFTLIELMIVIAIIGILAAIAIPNFISYRNKAYCSAAESDANMIASAIANYYAIPSHVTVLTTPDITAAGVLNLTLSGPAGAVNTATLAGTIDTLSIAVTDVSGRCPLDYTTSQADWAGSVFTKTMQ